MPKSLLFYHFNWFLPNIFKRENITSCIYLKFPFSMPALQQSHLSIKSQNLVKYFNRCICVSYYSNSNKTFGSKSTVYLLDLLSSNVLVYISMVILYSLQMTQEFWYQENHNVGTSNHDRKIMTGPDMEFSCVLFMVMKKS